MYKYRYMEDTGKTVVIQGARKSTRKVYKGPDGGLYTMAKGKKAPLTEAQRDQLNLKQRSTRKSASRKRKVYPRSGYLPYELKKPKKSVKSVQAYLLAKGAAEPQVRRLTNRGILRDLGRQSSFHGRYVKGPNKGKYPLFRYDSFALSYKNPKSKVPDIRGGYI